MDSDLETKATSRRKRRALRAMAVPSLSRPTGILLLALVGALLLATTAVAGGGSGPPVNTELPSIGGTPTEGKSLKLKEGKWTGESPIKVKVLWWERCPEGSSCERIGGATESSYVLQAADVGDRIQVTVLAENNAGKVEKASTQTEKVAGVSPKNETPPKIEQGEPEEGELISANAGKWQGTPARSYTYVWETTCPKKKCSFVSRETTTHAESSYRVPSEAIVVAEKATVTVTVTDENVAGSKSATSAATQAVKAGPPANVEAPTIEGEAREGHRLTANHGTWAGTQPVNSFEYHWAACNAISGCTPVGTNSTTYTPTGFEVRAGDKLMVTVTAKNSIGSTSVASSSVGPIAGSSPVVKVAPILTGLAEEGQPLTVSSGTWEGTEQEGAEPLSYTYQWQLCKAGTCANIAGATSPSYQLVAEDVGASLQAIVKAKGYVEPPGEATSNQSAEVGSGYDVVSWGENYRGDLGTIYRNGGEPNPVSAELPPLVQVQHDAGVTPQGTVVTWGLDKDGALGNGDSEYRSSWERPGGYSEVVEVKNEKQVALTNVKQVSAGGGGYRLAVLDNGEVRTWGGDQYGQFGIWQGNAEHEVECKPANSDAVMEARGCPTNTAKTPELPEAATQVASGGGADFAVLKSGEVYAWGFDDDGQLGVAEPVEACHQTEFEKKNEEGLPCVTRPKPVVFASGEPIGEKPGQHVVLVAAGSESAYALLENGHVLSWGSNSKGQIGANNEQWNHSQDTRPTEVVNFKGEALSEVSQLAASEKHVLALIKGAVWGWGDANKGELGEIDEHEHKCAKDACVIAAQELVGLESGVEEIDAGGFNGYALKGGEVYSWGSNSAGQLGNGEPVNEGTVGGEEEEEGGECATEGKECRAKPEPVLERSGKHEPLEHVRRFAAGYHSVYALVTGTRPQPLVTVTTKEEASGPTFTTCWQEIGGGERLNFSPLTAMLEVTVTGTTEKGSPVIKEATGELGLLKVGMELSHRGAFDDRTKIEALNVPKEGPGEITMSKGANTTHTAEPPEEPVQMTFETTEGEDQQDPIGGDTCFTASRWKGLELKTEAYGVHLHTEGKPGGESEQRVFAVLP